MMSSLVFGTKELVKTEICEDIEVPLEGGQVKKKKKKRKCIDQK